MTGQQIDRDRLRALASGATPGPWENVWEEADEWYSITGQSYEELVCPEVATLTDEDDAEFIAASRQAVPALLDMLDQAEQRIRDLTQEVRDERAACLDQIEQVQARAARIQAVEALLDSEERSAASMDLGACGIGEGWSAAVSVAAIRRALGGEQ